MPNPLPKKLLDYLKILQGKGINNASVLYCLFAFFFINSNKYLTFFRKNIRD